MNWSVSLVGSGMSLGEFFRADSVVTGQCLLVSGLIPALAGCPVGCTSGYISHTNTIAIAIQHHPQNHPGTLTHSTIPYPALLSLPLSYPILFTRLIPYINAGYPEPQVT